MTEESVYDLAVIGAGIYGIQAARTYLDIHPGHNVIIFEASSCFGGVWSQERTYEEFWTQTTTGIAEFSDMPLGVVPGSDSYYGFFPARYLSKYLEQYVAKHVYANATLESRIRLNSRVRKLIKSGSGWVLEVYSATSDEEELYRCLATKVMDATGLTSTPNMPSLPGTELFAGPITHHLEFGSIQTQLRTTKHWQRVIVIGGAKSAADMVYTCAKSGRKVSWIIRRSGAGPAAFVSVKGNGMYRNSNESFYTRFTSYFLASVFLDESKTVLGRFLYGTRLGKWLLNTIWHKIDDKAHCNANYNREDGKANRFYDLKPDTSIFWQNDSTGICQRPDFFDVVAQNVSVFREDIARVTKQGVELKNEQIVEGDIILCGTGWKTSHPDIVDCEGNDLGPRLGLASSHETSTNTHDNDWSKIELNAASKILNRFTILNNPPIKPPEPGNGPRPLRLYKGILPVQDRSIVFLGQVLLGNNFRVAEVQALFAVAGLDGNLNLPSEVEMRKDIAKVIAWNRLRYLKKGQQGTWLYWDMVPYTDHLLDLLGLRSHRHQNFFKDLFTPCFAKDLRDLITEYRFRSPVSERVQIVTPE